MKTPITIQRRQYDDLTDLGADIHPVLARVFAARGIGSVEDIQHGLDTLVSYDQLTGIEQAVKLLETALDKQQKILVIGDFDADGATSTALMVRVLRDIGADIDFLLPDRFRFGYGLSPEIVAVAAQQEPDLLITVDNGIASLTGVQAAHDLGIKVLITDHHLPGASLPDADAIVNPNLPGDQFPSKALAGVGTAFYLLVALRARLRARNWFTEHGFSDINLANYLDLVALGTVADVVQLDHNNRVLVAQGLARIRAGKCCAGISALLDIANRSLAHCRSSDLAFAVGPRLNAAGRLEDMHLGVKCLLTDDPAKAADYARELDELNQQRRVIEQEMKQEAEHIVAGLSMDDESLPMGLCLYGETWHEGVVGIVASRLKDATQRPVIAFANSNGLGADGEPLIKGSARSVPAIHIRDLLDVIATAHPQLLAKFGGHAMAAGMTIRQCDYQAFSELFAAEVGKHMNEQHCQTIILSDGELSASDINLALAEQIRLAAPWGQGFPEPLFDGEFVIVERRILADRHLKLRLRLATDTNQGGIIDAIAFNQTDRDWPETVTRVKLAYRLDINRFRGAVNLQLMAEYVEPVRETRSETQLETA